MKIRRAVAVVCLSSLTLHAQQQPIPPSVAQPIADKMKALAAELEAAMLPKIDCDLSDPVITSAPDGACDATGHQPTIETLTYTIAIPPENGGEACGPLVVTRPGTQDCIPPPLAVDCDVDPDPPDWTVTSSAPNGSCQSNNEQEFLEQLTRVVVTAPSVVPPGAACPALAGSRVVQKPCVFVPTPTFPTAGPVGPRHGLAHGVPNLAANPTKVSARNGPWSDPATWNPAGEPTDADIVAIVHAIDGDAPDMVYTAINVHDQGALLTRPTVSTKLTGGTITVYPGGTFLQAAIWPATSELVFNQPIDTAIDPEQYGNGLLCFDATCGFSGEIKTAFVRLAVEPTAGVSTLTLATAPQNWHPGDRLVLPDSRQLAGADFAPKAGNGDNTRRKVSQSEVVTIASITGTAITLTTPVVYAHKGARDPDGQLQFLPHVGNLTRNVTVRSDNQTGPRGHVLINGAGTYKVVGAAFVSLGRTTEAYTHSATFDSNGTLIALGTNQIGRYPLHFHHVPGTCGPQPFQYEAVGNVIEDGRKWSMTLHNSHYGRVANNVIYGATGAALATEDGSETGNVIEGNLLVKIENSTKKTNHDEVTGGTDPFGRLGNGFWFRGAANVVRNNVVADTREGIGYYTGSSEDPTSAVSHLATINVPNFPCADTMTAGQFTTKEMRRIYNHEMSGNEVYSTSQFAVGTWFFEMPSSGRNPFTNLTLWHNIESIHGKYWNGTITDLRIVNEGGAGLAINQDNFQRSGQATRSELHRANIQGVSTVYAKSGQLILSPTYLITDSVFRSKNGWQLSGSGQQQVGDTIGSTFTFRNTRFEALPGLPLIAFVLSETGAANTVPKRFEVFSHQGDAADNFRLYFTSQAPPNGKYGAVATCSATQSYALGAFVCP